jgi:adenylate cyclase
MKDQPTPSPKVETGMVSLSPQAGAPSTKSLGGVMKRVFLGVFLLFFWGLLQVIAFRSSHNPFDRYLEYAEMFLFDARMRFHGGVPFDHDRIALVGIDENTFKTLGADARFLGKSKWPLPNSFHADVAQKLISWGAKAVVFDFLSFTNPSRPEFHQEDEQLRRLASETGKIVLAATFYYSSFQSWGETIQETGIQSWETPARVFAGIPYGFVNCPLDPGGWVRQFLPAKMRLDLFPEVTLALKGLQAASLPVQLPDSQSAFRYITFARPDHVANQVVPYQKILMLPNDRQTEASPASSESRLENHSGNPDTPDTLGIPGTPAAGPGSSATASLGSTSLLAQTFRDKVVFIGAMYRDSHDFFFTPFFSRRDNSPTPGFFIHAMIANQLLHGWELRRFSPQLERNLTILFGGAGILFAWLFPQIPGFLSIVLLMLGSHLAGFHLFRSSLAWIPLAAPTCALAGCFIAHGFARHAYRERKHAQARKMFSAYVSPEVMTYVLDHTDMLKLEGERREVSVFFSDLAGFTTISETVSPEKLSALLNEYLTPMSHIIMANRGYIDKYIGDAIMAVFGIPFPDSQHAFRACLAAVQQKEKMRELREVFAQAYGVKISVRMGINTGWVCAGNMGSMERFQYTVMGDTVNQASRFEGANKVFGSAIMIGETTYRLAQEQILARILAKIVVKGKTEPVVVYELMGMKGLPQSGSEPLERLIPAFNEAFVSFSKGEFDAAALAFKQCLSYSPEDGPSRFYLDLCETYRSNPPKPPFQGEIVLTSK